MTSTTPPVLNQIDLIVSDVPGAVSFFHDVVGLIPSISEERFAQLESGAMTIMLSPDALIPMEPAGGIILHFQVSDVGQALAQAQEKGATLLWGPQKTDWYTESVLIKGPGGIRIDLYRPLQP